MILNFSVNKKVNKGALSIQIISFNSKLASKFIKPTFFHTAVWFRIWENKNMKFKVLLVKENGKEIGYVPILFNKRDNSVKSSARGTYGGFVGDVDFNKLIEIYNLVYTMFKNVWFVLPINLDKKIEKFKVENRFSVQSQITKNFTEQWPKRNQQYLKNLLAKNHSFKLISHSEDLIQFHEKYIQFSENWKDQKSLLNIIQFNKIYKNINTDTCSFHTLEIENSIEAIALVFYHNKTQYQWIYSNSRSYKGGANLLQYYLFNSALEKECEKIDLLSSRVNQENIKKHKQQFGNITLEHSVITK